MQRLTLQKSHTLALLFTGILATGSTFADKPSWVADNKYEKHDKNEHHDNHGEHDRGRDVISHEYFGDQHRVIIRDYYDEEYRSGHCPPGLAKKHNGCLPPGQEKKWRIGRPLPREVIFYDLPPTVVMHLGTPPAGHRYVRVATDILLIAAGTGMVIDAIEDLGRQ